MTASPILPNLKFCKRCNCETERYKYGACKVCQKENAKKWLEKNKPIVAAAHAKWAAANKERRSVQHAAWREANKEKLQRERAERYIQNRDKELAAAKDYKKKNPDKVRAAESEWRKANPDIVRVYKSNRRARESVGKLSTNITERLFSLQKGKCACCRVPLGDKYHLDHIMPLALGGTNTDDNVQLLTQRCNNQKHAKHPVDFMQQRGFLL